MRTFGYVHEFSQCNVFCSKLIHLRAPIRLRNRPDFSRRKFVSDCSLARVPLSSLRFPKYAYLLLTLRRIRLSIRNLAEHFALHHSCFLGYFETTRSYRALRDSMVLHQTQQRRIKWIIGDSLAWLSRTSLAPGRRNVDRLRRTLVMDTDREGIPFRRAKGREDSEGGCRHSVHRSLTRLFLFSRNRKEKHLCVQIATYTSTIAYARSVLVAYNDQSYEGS